MLDTIRRTPHLDWLLVTKRPQNWRTLVGAAIAQVPGHCDRWDETIGWVADWICGEPPANVWVLTSVENQECAARRIPAVLEIPAVVHGLSCEPLLGWVDLSPWIDRLDWVIAGGESGPDARPSHPGQFRSLRDQCQEARVPFFFKQWGEYTPRSPMVPLAGGKEVPRALVGDPESEDVTDEVVVYRVGKKSAGRVLDGREWSEFPTPRPIGATPP
jgi:protein gp37